ncbi:MAG: T9SS type A sorting domain-containing protein [Melioribacteraceae bacterium]|nr:T9SS type A sorting domain-containing protein [Melioribacteraceae bacterium]MCF8355237.1 T9SS type A sorting domain-containing protein [Melioribacteraceae bacterium]MCF8395224.1 T9SS type A sorting domain-containing protein [Melioribacteraceae bacterium]MCF8420698.1 T9SS type A sorting domain-containing protein [Melioribacteraceae bacterium]
MNKIYLPAILFLLVAINIEAQISWTRVHPKLQDQIQDIAVIDANTAVAVGSNGGVFVTVNGGTTWSTSSPVTSSNLYGVSYSNGKLWAVGTAGTIIRSVDTAATWTLINDPTVVGDLMTVTFINASTGWAAGELGVIYKSTDGGSSWASQNGMTLQSGWFRDVYFLDANNGFVCGTNQSYGRTTDGGSNWAISESASFTQQTNFDIDFYDNLNGWMVGTGDASVTSDGGATWTNTGLSNAVFGETMYDIEMVNNMIWYISGSNGKIGRTYDGGTNWVFTTVGNGSFNMYACGFSSTINGWTVGDGGVIFKTTDGSNWNSQIATKTRNSLTGCFFFNNDTGYVIGNSGTILKTLNGGVSWSDESAKLGTSNNLHDIYFPSDTVGYICGDAVFYSTMNGGVTWDKQTLSKEYYTVKFIDEDIGWMMGSTSVGVIAKTTNRGAAWTTTTPPNDSPIYDFEILNANIAVAVGFLGAVYKTTDGGSNWSEFTPRFTNDNLTAVDFFDDGLLGLATSPSGMIYRTTDGGATWDTTDSRLTINNPLYDITIINPDNIYAVGDQGSVYYSNDVGVSWNDVSDNMTAFQYNAVVATDRSHFWRVGDGGNVHYGVDATAGQTPAPSIQLYPIDGDIDIPVNAGLKWMDSGAAAPTGFVIYFGTDGGGNTSPTNIENGTDLGNVNTYTPGSDLAFGTTYYWQIVPYNINGSTPSGYCPIWSFTTRESLSFGGGGLTAPGYFFANSTPAASGAPSQPTYSWIDPIAGGMTPVNNWTSGNSDDGYYGPVSLGITFPFFGINYTDVYIGSNGVVSFGAGYSGTGSSASIPNFAAPNNIVAALLMDLDSTNAVANVYYGTGSGKFYITWYHYTAKGTTDEISFQLILYSDGYVQVQYSDTESTFPLPASIGNDALIGIENIYGNKGVEYRNNGVGGNIFGSPVAVSFGDNSEGALPVELVSFYASATSQNVTLHWQTATEVNNYGFSVERTLVRSEERTETGPASSQTDYAGTSWETLGFVEGHGNSNSPKDYSFTDDLSLNPNLNLTHASYRLKQIDLDGHFEYSEIITVETENILSLPTEFALYQNYPNPFNPTTTIKFDLPVESRVQLIIYNILGQQVEVLIDKIMRAGFQKVKFNASKYASGVYIYRINAGDFVETKKLILLR